MGLIAFPQTLENLNCFLLRRLLDHNALKPPFQRRILFDMLAVFIKGGRSHQLQLSASKLRLQDVGRIDRSFGGTNAHHIVDLVDKKNDVAGGRNLAENCLDAFFKIAPVFGPREH